MKPVEESLQKHQLILLSEAQGVTTKLVEYAEDGVTVLKSSDPITNVAVLKKGIKEEWGYDHIFVYVRDGIPGNTRAKQVMDKFPQFQTTDDVFEAIDDVLRTGTKDGSVVKKAFNNNYGDPQYLEVALADKYPGSVTTILIGDLV